MIVIKRLPLHPQQKLRIAVLLSGLVVLCCTAIFAKANPTHAVSGESSFALATGSIVVSQVMQMSVVIETPAGVIYTDPTQGKSRYSAYPTPDLILISHEHHEHFDHTTLEQLVGPTTRIVVPPFVMQQLPASLKSQAVALANGEMAELGNIRVEAIPAYGLRGQSARWHPFGRGNGYVLTVDGQRLYIAGSTEATPEVLQLQNINIAFLPLYPPYAMGVNDAIQAVQAIKPQFTYIYQYNSRSTRDNFIQKMNNNPVNTIVVAPDIPF
ncbi:MBL fold metallo-hydrolase [Rheinheimera sp. 1928-s]|uniref:MBL fold metallo-hydrolase n=1 Tax=Rheinheimera sp. 1928-s TaxID=3033803 RepID=UPI00261FA9AB|nr:MBL fold metallo-hydrolase [Rheinheimera sp. 1928-s]MDF3125215.1 MBL fold metallo-hydrolase [Rheinheimera sp. 1928-s]